VAVADIFDALTAQRPYKKEWALDNAFVELERLASLGKLDPDCVAALRINAQEVFEVLRRYVDSDAEQGGTVTP
jgi:HD-GYP domain-containing protein (c-di-GMP phosphodiesterase class II)